MSDLEAVELLTQAKERLFECGWGTGVRYRRSEGGTMCLEEALCGKHGQYINNDFYAVADAVKRGAAFVARAIGIGTDLWIWNDEQESAGPVFDALDRAIEIAKEAPNPAE